MEIKNAINCNINITQKQNSMDDGKIIGKKTYATILSALVAILLIILLIDAIQRPTPINILGDGILSICFVLLVHNRIEKYK